METSFPASPDARLPNPFLLSPVAVVIKLIIASKCNQDAKSCSQRVEYLSGCIDPDLNKYTSLVTSGTSGQNNECLFSSLEKSMK